MFRRSGRPPFEGALLAALGVVAQGCATAAQEGYEERLKLWQHEAAVSASLSSAGESVEDEPVFDDAEELSEASLVEAVLRRSPTLDAARQAWRAALEEVPQATSLEDPMLAFEVAPLSVPLPGREREVPFGQSVMLQQRLPFPGKLEARGAMALSSADAKQHSLQATRLSLALMASTIWADYFATERALASNEELQGVLRGLRDSAEAHLETGHASLRDPLKAEVELAHLAHERVVLEARRRVLRTRLNGLLHRAPDAPLPPPPVDVELSASALESQEPLVARALKDRPELAAARASVGGAEAALELAGLSYAPDVALSGQYTSMVPMAEHQWMVGAALNLPLQVGRRESEREEARARLSRAVHEEARVVDEVQTEVAVSRERVRAAREILQLYDARLLPTARAQLEASLASLEAGTRGYFDVLEAEKDLRMLRLAREQAVADVLKRRAELERALGVVPGLGHPLEGEER